MKYNNVINSLSFILVCSSLLVLPSCKKDSAPEERTELPLKFTVLVTTFEIGFAPDSSVNKFTLKAYDDFDTFNFELVNGTKVGTVAIDNPELITDFTEIKAHASGGILIYRNMTPVTLKLNDDSGREITLKTDKNTDLWVQGGNGFDLTKIEQEKTGAASTVTARAYFRYALEKTINVQGVSSGRIAHYNYQVL